MTIIEMIDDTSAYDEKKQILLDFNKVNPMPHDLTINVHRFVYFEFKRDTDQLNKFLETLPKQLKVKLSAYGFEFRYSNLKFFKNRSLDFISWICPLMTPQWYDYDDFFFIEGDECEQIFFIIKGSAQFVLPKYGNQPYIKMD
jgi:hypothetical protein